jgi:hypothetical protein
MYAIGSGESVCAVARMAGLSESGRVVLNRWRLRLRKSGAGTFCAARYSAQRNAVLEAGVTPGARERGTLPSAKLEPQPPNEHAMPACSRRGESAGVAKRRGFCW